LFIELVGFIDSGIFQIEAASKLLDSAVASLNVLISGAHGCALAPYLQFLGGVHSRDHGAQAKVRKVGVGLATNSVL